MSRARLLANGCYRPPTGRWPSSAELDAGLVVLTLAFGIWWFWSVRK